MVVDTHRMCVLVVQVLPHVSDDGTDSSTSKPDYQYAEFCSNRQVLIPFPYISSLFEYINAMYLKPMLVRPKSLKRRGLSILNVFQKLHEKDIREYMDHNGSVLFCSRPYVSATTSMGGLLIHHPSPASLSSEGESESAPPVSRGEPDIPLPMPDNNSSTCLDMQALESRQHSRKMKDDGKVHHIIEDAMFMPRQRFSRHRRHMLPESDVHPQFHHKARLHLRHLVSPQQSQANGYVRTMSNGCDSNGKPRKNVSFADTPCIDFEDERDAGSAIAEAASMDSSRSSSVSDAGIMFSADRSDDTSQPEPVSPTMAEITLPWKRNTGRDPVSCTVIHSLPDDDEPQLGEVPSWVNNTDYTSPAVATQEIMERQQSNASSHGNHNSCHSNHSADLSNHHVDVDLLDNQHHNHSCIAQGCLATEPLLVCDSMQQSAESEGGLPPPWQTHTNPSDYESEPPAPSSWNMPSVDNMTVPAHWAAPSQQSDQPEQPYGDENGNNPLPPPWHTCNDDATTEQDEVNEYTPLVGDQGDGPPLPWLHNMDDTNIEDTSYRTKANAVTSDPSKSCPVFHTKDPSLEGEVDSMECIPPPPWRSNSNIDVSLDQHAPRPQPDRTVGEFTSGIPPPWRTNGSTDDNNEATCSPSLSHDMDAFSLRPQPSSHSFRFSEAESKHSEHMHVHHHMIERHVAPPGAQTDNSEPCSLDVEPEEMDLYERVFKWLVESEPHLYQAVPCEDVELVAPPTGTELVSGCGWTDCDDSTTADSVTT